MTEITAADLGQLLDKYDGNRLVDQCLIALNDPSLILISPGRPLNVDSALQMYTVRAEINQEKHNAVEGYAEVLAALNVETEESVNLYNLLLPDRWFILFTSIRNERLLGILMGASNRPYRFQLDKLRCPSNLDAQG